MKTYEAETLVANGIEASHPPSHGSWLSGKIQARHLERQAIVYVRQSSTRQVQENIESTQLQYGLVDRAKALGWPGHQVVVIDDDLGVSGQSLEGRAGFQRLLAEISLGHVGMVLGIEMSRLARSCRDWHHLLELCAVFGALLGDADGVYEPRDYNDRLLLGFKGTMSEAELHVLRGRLDAGKRNKARRGEYFAQAPTGYLRTDEGIVLEPDEQARDVVQLVLDKFEELGSVNGVLRCFRGEGIRLGIRAGRGPDRGQLTWRVPSRTTLLGILHHPIYAGAYVYCPARGGEYTKTSVGALCRKLRRLGLIAKRPAVKPNYWPPSSLAERLRVKMSTLSGWRRRGWLQARQVGGRRIYWADQAEMKRLEQLAARDRTGFKVTPRELTTAVSRMPEP